MAIVFLQRDADDLAAWMSPTPIQAGPVGVPGSRACSPKQTGSNRSWTWSGSTCFRAVSASSCSPAASSARRSSNRTCSSPNDGYAAPPEQAAIGDAVLSVHDRCLDLISQGVPASLLEEVDFSALIRARDAAGPADVDTVTEHRDRVLASLPIP